MDTRFWNPYRRKNYLPFYGTITEMGGYGRTGRGNDGCMQLISVENEEGAVTNFVVSADTYVVDLMTLYEGQEVIVFYEADGAAPLIYPPQYPAAIVTWQAEGVNVSVGYFNRALLNVEQSLKLNIGPDTRVVTENNQIYEGNPGNHTLIVEYGAVTRSVPAQTTPERIIVLCGEDYRR